jgi:hypothetical protein
VANEEKRSVFSVMRRQFVSMALAGAAVMTASLGVVPTFENAEATASPTVAVQRVNPRFPEVRDEAAMVLVGAALIGLAAAVRRAA